MKTHFCKIIISPSLQFHKLSLPPAFIKKSGSSLSNYAYLKAPRGFEQKVHLRKQDDGIWFTDGWKDFAELYSIAFGYFLVFRCKGNSRFDVFIYDESTCEIDYPNFDTQSSDEDEDNDDEDLGKGKVKMSQVFRKAKAFQCDNPNFTLAMNISYVKTDSRMWVPLHHAGKYLEGATEVVLQIGANSKVRDWIVSVTRGSGYVGFSAGWALFALANRLEVNDVCKFELINRRTHTYRAHIFLVGLD